MSSCSLRLYVCPFQLLNHLVNFYETLCGRNAFRGHHSFVLLTSRSPTNMTDMLRGPLGTEKAPHNTLS
jgi:hypothetical protein